MTSSEAKDRLKILQAIAASATPGCHRVAALSPADHAALTLAIREMERFELACSSEAAPNSQS